jgi:hypothetical protein
MREVGWVAGDGEEEQAPLSVDEAARVCGKLLAVHVPIERSDTGAEVEWWWYGACMHSHCPPQFGPQGVFLGARVLGLQGASKLRRRAVYGMPGSSVLAMLPLNQLYMAFEVAAHAGPAAATRRPSEEGEEEGEEEGAGKGDEEETTWQHLRRLTRQLQRRPQEAAGDIGAQDGVRDGSPGAEPEAARDALELADEDRGAAAATQGAETVAEGGARACRQLPPRSSVSLDGPRADGATPEGLDAPRASAAAPSQQAEGAASAIEPPLAEPPLVAPVALPLVNEAGEPLLCLEVRRRSPLEVLAACAAPFAKAQHAAAAEALLALAGEPTSSRKYSATHASKLLHSCKGMFRQRRAAPVAKADDASEAEGREVKAAQGTKRRQLGYTQLSAKRPRRLLVSGTLGGPFEDRA